MEYKKGQILTYHFPRRTVRKMKISKVITEYHRVVVLHSRGTPYNTVLIAPITKAKSLKKDEKLPSNYVELMKEDYLVALEFDSYINLDMCIVVDVKELNKLTKYSKTLNVILNDDDINQLEYKIILTYELSKYIHNTLTKELEREFKNVIKYIEGHTKIKLIDVLGKIEDINLRKDILEIINNLVDELTLNYIKK